VRGVAAARSGALFDIAQAVRPALQPIE